MHTTLILILSIIIAFYVTWAIGANDVANTVASAIGSNSLTWKHCIIIASIGEIAGAAFLGSKVITTIATDILPLSTLETSYEIISTMMSALISTGIWVQVSSIKGMPVSTTHAVVSAIVGIGIFFHGYSSINWIIIKKIALAWLLSPVAAGLMSMFCFLLYKKTIFESSAPFNKSILYVTTTLYLLPIAVGSVYLRTYNILNILNMIILLISTAILGSLVVYLYSKTENFSLPEKPKIYRRQKLEIFAEKIGISEIAKHTEIVDIFNNAMNKSRYKKTKTEIKFSESYKKTTKIFRTGQVITSFLASLGHGSNDVSNGVAPVAVILWVLNNNFSDTIIIPKWLTILGGLGIATGIVTLGKKVVKTVGSDMITINPFKGFIIQLSTAVTVLSCSVLGLPVSTSHAIIGSVVGTHLSNRNQNFNLSTLTNIFLAWIFTVPICMASAIFIKYTINITYNYFYAF